VARRRRSFEVEFRYVISPLLVFSIWLIIRFNLDAIPGRSHVGFFPTHTTPPTAKVQPFLMLPPQAAVVDQNPIGLIIVTWADLCIGNAWVCAQLLLRGSCILHDPRRVIRGKSGEQRCGSYCCVTQISSIRFPDPQKRQKYHFISLTLLVFFCGGPPRSAWLQISKTVMSGVTSTEYELVDGSTISKPAFDVISHEFSGMTKV